MAITKRQSRTMKVIKRYNRPVNEVAQRALVKIYGIDPADVGGSGYVIDDRMRLIVLISKTLEEIEPVTYYPNFVDCYTSQYTGLNFLVMSPVEHKFQEVVDRCQELRSEWMRSHNELP